MTNSDINTISSKIESLHSKILKDKFIESVTESEMTSLILAVGELIRQKAEIERLENSIKEANEYFSKGDFAKGLAIVIRLAEGY